MVETCLDRKLEDEKNGDEDSDGDGNCFISLVEVCLDTDGGDEKNGEDVDEDGEEGDIEDGDDDGR